MEDIDNNVYFIEDRRRITDRTRNRRNAMARRNTSLNPDEIGMESNKNSMMSLPETIMNYSNKTYSSLNDKEKEEMLNDALEKGKGLGGKRRKRKSKRRKSRRRKNKTKSKKI